MAFEKLMAHVLFMEYNARYFNGRLPFTAIRFVEQKQLGRCCPEERYILISKRIMWSRVLVGETLLHEMIHLDTGVAHGWRFKFRLYSLHLVGAFMQFHLPSIKSQKKGGD